MSDVRAIAPRLTPYGVQALQVIAQHRLLSTNQLHAIRGPGASRRGTLRVLSGLDHSGLIAHVRTQGALKAWHVTEAGGDLVQRIDPLAQPVKILSPHHASGALQAHTLAVNDVGICFLQAARGRGDDFGPLSWRHEIAHTVGTIRGRPRQVVIADALLTYLVTGDDGRSSLQYRFIELDRATLTIDRLARKLSRYAGLYRHRNRGGEHPAWRAFYPAFPAVLCVLASQRRHILERRLGAVAALCRTDLDLAETPQVAIAIGLLEDLQSRGIFAPVFFDVRRPEEPINWMGRREDRRR